MRYPSHLHIFSRLQKIYINYFHVSLVKYNNYVTRESFHNTIRCWKWKNFKDPSRNKRVTRVFNRILNGATYFFDLNRKYLRCLSTDLKNSFTVRFRMNFSGWYQKKSPTLTHEIFLVVFDYYLKRTNLFHKRSRVRFIFRMYSSN